MVYGTAPALVTLSLPPARHGRGLGTMSLGIGVGLGVGPVLGGLLVDGLGWPAAFVFRAPLFLILALLALTRFGRVAGAAPRPRRFMVADLLRLPVLGAGTLAFLSQYAQFAVWLLMPFFLVTARGLSPSVGGVVFVLTPLATALAAPLGGVLTDRIGPRWPLRIGLALEAAGLLAIGAVSETTSIALVGAAMALVGFGAGLFQVPNLALMMAAFSPTALPSVRPRNASPPAAPCCCATASSPPSTPPSSPPASCASSRRVWPCSRPDRRPRGGAGPRYDGGHGDPRPGRLDFRGIPDARPAARHPGGRRHRRARQLEAQCARPPGRRGPRARAAGRGPRREDLGQARRIHRRDHRRPRRDRRAVRRRPHRLGRLRVVHLVEYPRRHAARRAGDRDRRPGHA